MSWINHFEPKPILVFNFKCKFIVRDVRRNIFILLYFVFIVIFVIWFITWIYCSVLITGNQFRTVCLSLGDNFIFWRPRNTCKLMVCCSVAGIHFRDYHHQPRRALGCRSGAFGPKGFLQSHSAIPGGFGRRHSDWRRPASSVTSCESLRSFLKKLKKTFWSSCFRAMHWLLEDVLTNV